MVYDSSLADLQADELTEIYEEKIMMNKYDKMMTYLEGLYFELLDKNQYGSEYQFDDSWIDDIRQFNDLDNSIDTIITHLENSDYSSAILYVQSMLDSDQTSQLNQVESERIARLSSEEVGNL